jgi:TIR domain
LTSKPQDHASPSARDFFVSYNHNDEGWAEWIADVLEKASYSTTIQAWDILPGSNFVVEMHKATSECKKTIAVLSPDYLASMFTQAEWAVAFSVDPSEAERKLIPIRVRMCEPPGLLRPIVFCDLLGLHEEPAKAAILKAVSEGRVRPGQVLFPGSSLPEASPGPAGGRQRTPASHQRFRLSPCHPRHRPQWNS